MKLFVCCVSLLVAHHRLAGVALPETPRHLSIGEPQIFGQMKSAFAVAQEAGAVGFHLNLIFPEAFRIGKKVRTDTAIGENPVSVAYAGVIWRGRSLAIWSAARHSFWVQAKPSSLWPDTCGTRVSPS